MKLLGSITKDYTINILKWGYLNKKFSEKFILSVQQSIGHLLNKKIQKYKPASPKIVANSINTILQNLTALTIEM